MKQLTALFVLGLSLAAPVFADTPTFAPSVPQSLQDQTLADLKFVDGLQGNFATPIYRKIFGGAYDGKSLGNFFSQRIASFDMDDCGGGPGVMACVQPRIDSHVMWVTQNYVKFNIPQIYRISVVFHESRHSEDENRNWGHVNCPTPFRDENGNDIKGIISGTILAGLPACDTTNLGAYGLQAELLKNTELNCTNCSEKMKMDGQLFGDDTVKRISNSAAHDQLVRDVSTPR